MSSSRSPANEDAYAIHGVDPSKATDQELLTCLRKKYRRCKVEKRVRKLDSLEVNAGLATLDPSDLPACFVMSPQKRAPQLETKSGFWKEKQGGFTAIRSNDGEQRYAGMRVTMEFYTLFGGIKTDWIMHQFYLLDTHNINDLYFEEEMVLCKVFKKESCGELHYDGIDYLRTLDSNSPQGDSYNYNGPDCEEKLERYITSFSDCLLGEPTDTTRSGKRPRSCGPGEKSSEVWRHFTRVHTKDPDVVYAVCHCCDGVFKAHSRNGTSHLKRHSEKCSSKHQLPWHNGEGTMHNAYAGWGQQAGPPPAQVFKNCGG